MKINELYNDFIIENTDYELKSILNKDNPIKWAKTIVAYANGKHMQFMQTITLI